MESISLSNSESVEGKNRDGREKNFGKGKKKIIIEKIEKKEHRMVTFSKRRKGLFNKCREFYYLTGIDIAVIVSSPAGQMYAYGMPTVEVMIDRYFQSLADFVANKENINEEEEEDDDDDDQDQEQDDDDVELELLIMKRRNLEKIKNELGKLF